MSERLFLVSVSRDSMEAVSDLCSGEDVLDCQILSSGESGDRRTIQLLVTSHGRQKMLDALQSRLSGDRDWRISVVPIEATLPRPDEADAENGGKKAARRAAETREELYSDVASNARLDMNFLALAALSTLVAAIGLLGDDTAVVIGAMVIAPLLGPNLAFALGVALGDRALMISAMKTNAAGLALSMSLCVLLGVLTQPDLSGGELMARTRVGFSGIALALAAGAAATLSLTAGASTALVGVMVAVALLPPAATAGIMAGVGRWDLAGGALLLLAVNVVCINISAQAVFLLRGVRPRTWFEKEKARRATRINAAIWAGLLLALAVLLWARALNAGAP